MSVNYPVQHRLRLDTHQQSMSLSPKLERPSRSPDDIIKRFLEYRPPQPSSSANYRIHRRTRSYSPRPSVTPPMPVHRRIKSHSTTMFTPISRPLEEGPRFVDEDGQPLQPRQPSGPKTKFTPDDDALLVNLKEKHDLTWKRISDFFPGRSSGTLQVRYCTKLKAKGMTWNDEMVSRLLDLHSQKSVLLTLHPDLTSSNRHARVRK